MAMAARDLRWATELEKTNAMMLELTEDELQAIQSVAKVFIMNPSIERPYRPLSEEQLFQRINMAIKHAEQGQCRDSAEVEADLSKEFGLF